ncbi:hypothetical protein LCGC14_2760830 [marine sediment metagenome]|uniref:Uncharacterized protein n=1 Tax=marine sediment metagenome TaxID=412755 RepID=A0A0F8YYZ8_9ZZZZ
MSNQSFTILESAARVADVSSVQDNLVGRGILIVVDVTADPASAAVTPKIRVRDENGDYNEVYWTADAAISATGEFSYLIFPTGLATGSKELDVTETVNAPLPREWQLFMDHADADSITYSVRGHYIS